MNKATKYLISNFLNTFISLFATLFFIMTIVFFIQISKFTSYIEINYKELFQLYILMLPQILLFTVPIAFFVSTAISFYRLSKENEIIVIFTLGYDPKKIAKSFFITSLAISVLMLINALFAIPFAEYTTNKFIEYKKTNLSLNIKPNEFGQKFGDWMIYIDNAGEKYTNIVMFNPSGKTKRLITATSSDIENINSGLNLKLANGNVYDISDQKLNVLSYKELNIASLISNINSEDFSITGYWKQIFTSEKIAKNLSIYVLVALFPVASVLFGLSFGIVTYRYEKGMIYFGVFAVLFLYFALIMSFAKQPLYAITIVFLGSLLLSSTVFKKRILNKY